VAKPCDLLDGTKSAHFESQGQTYVYTEFVYCGQVFFQIYIYIFFRPRCVGMSVICGRGTERKVGFISGYGHQNDIFCVANLAWKYNVHTKSFENISNVMLYVIFTPHSFRFESVCF